jgi:hypothetical protein
MVGVFGRLSVDFSWILGAGVYCIAALGKWTDLFSGIQIGTSAEESIIRTAKPLENAMHF